MIESTPKMKETPFLKNLTDPKYGKPPSKQNKLLQQMGRPHISSFNFMIERGLNKAVEDLSPVEFMFNSDKVSFSISSAHLNYCMVPTGTVGVNDTRVYPTECRQRAATYRGKLIAGVNWSINGCQQASFEKDMGEIPIMVKSTRCHLNKMTPKELVKHGEHEEEWGGYFIVKGHERIIRMLLMTRRNYPIAIKRSGWKMRGPLFSEYGVTVRCVKEDQTVMNNVLHFVTDGTAKFMFSYRKNLYYCPLILILKCLCDYCDQYIYQKLIQGYQEDSYYVDSIQKMLQLIHVEGLHTHEDCKKYVGKMFRVKFYDCPEWYSDIQITDFILKKCVLIHLDKNEDKFNLLIFMTQKLFMFAQDKCKPEGVDSVMMQELLLGGHLYLQILKERLQNWLITLKTNIIKRTNALAGSLTPNEVMNAAKKTYGLERGFQNFLATGNVQSSSGLGLMQDKGLTIVAENINRMRYMSHFKAVHRGAFFQEMRTTEVRQLLPDAWGFICPVHTPDGSPCGLLNHLTTNCIVTDMPDSQQIENIPAILCKLGMLSINYRTDTTQTSDTTQNYIVILDGKIIGYVAKDIVVKLVEKLRLHKIKGIEVPNTLEIVLVPFKNVTAQFPGLFLFTGPARMMRPVMNLSSNKIEYIGTFEQIYMDIAVTDDKFYPGVTTHLELSKLSFLSNLAQLIPMPDCNQSPRNMYQCQMGKQTMGTPCLNWSLQSETKLYRLQTPATPLFRPVHYDNINMDDFPMGTNAIVAVISYTGYDMEDAMIINKSSDERGFAHGSIFKTDFVQLEHATSYFCRNPEKSELSQYLETDGLPYIGRRIREGEPYYCYYSADESQYRIVKFHGKEECYVSSVKMCSNFETNNRTAVISFRIPRNPTVGDKFASRAGQKGICSQKWPTEDLPFTETGLVPDIVFNPHGFPSRMTIAMMIEVMAGKSAALHGLVHDATPFKFNEKDTAIDYFGNLLVAGGYNYFGTETMYSGIDGREMTAQIFFGIVHYQRLRHMVSDKWQVRSTGPADILTRQPLKGRKRGGGVRFGEMERDSLISHGASFLLQDRLLHCSDKTLALICTSCGTLLGPVTVVVRKTDRPSKSISKETCRLCGHGNNIFEIYIPYIFKFFVTQMASCNINVKISTTSV